MISLGELAIATQFYAKAGTHYALNQLKYRMLKQE